MNKTIYKISAALSAVTLAITSMLSLGSYAANTHDTYWEFSTGYVRQKEDASSIYVKNESDVNASMNVYAYTTDGNIHDVSTYRGSTVNTKNIYIPARSERLVKQFINELGYINAYVYFTGPGANGYWSPDSYGSYPYAN